MKTLKKISALALAVLFALTLLSFFGCEKEAPSGEHAANLPSAEPAGETASANEPTEAPEPTAEPEPEEPEYGFPLFHGGMAYFKTVGDKAGFIDKAGNVVIEPSFDSIEPISLFLDFWKRGYLLASKGGKYHIIDRTGREVCGTWFDSINNFSDNGLAGVTVDGKCGFIDGSLEFAVEPVFEWIENCRFGDNGLAAAKMPGGKWGYIDETGKYVIEPRFDSAHNFSFGLAAVNVDGKWGYIDESGNMVIEPRFDYLVDDFLEEGVARVFYREEDPSSVVRLIDREGNPTERPELEFMLSTKYEDTVGLKRIQLIDDASGSITEGYVDIEGNTVIEPKYRFYGNFAPNGLIAAARCNEGEDSKWGYLNSKGETVIDFQFDQVISFNRFGVASVCMGDKWGLIDENGDYLLEPTAKEYMVFYDYGYAVLRTDEGAGFVDAKGNIVIEPRDWYCSHFYDDGYAVVRTDKGCGVIDASGNFVIEPREDIQSIDW